MGRHTSGPEKAPKPTRSGPSEAPHSGKRPARTSGTSSSSAGSTTARSATARPQRNHPQRNRSSAHNTPKRNATQRVTQRPTSRPIADHTEQTEHKPAKSRTAHPRTSQTRVTPPHTRDDAPRSSNPRTTSTRRRNGAGEESSTSSTRVKQERQRRRTPKEIRPDGSQSHDAPVSPVDTDSKEKTPFTMWQWVLAVLLVIAGIATAVGVVMMWPSSSDPNVSPELANTNALPANQVNGTVAIRDTGACNSPSIGRAFDVAPISPLEEQPNKCERAIVSIDAGDNAGKRTLLVMSDKPGEPELHVGDKIRMSETTAADGTHAYTFSDFQRTKVLLLWGAVIILAIIGIGALRGARSILGLLITLAAIAFFLIPALLRGGSPLGLAVVCGSAILFAVLYLVHGFNWKSSSALGGTLLSLGLSAWLAHIAIDSNHLRGLGSEDNILIQLYLPDVTVPGLMLCGFIIGALGVLNDVTIAQASTVNELSEIEPDASPWRLFAGAMKVGRDHIASMVYTLVLSYTGASLPTLLLLSVANRPLTQIVFSDVMATELLRSGIGALALSLAVPITTIIAAFTVTGRRQRSEADA